jgi:hypothetical protein
MGVKESIFDVTPPGVRRTNSLLVGGPGGERQQALPPQVDR